MSAGSGSEAGCGCATLATLGLALLVMVFQMLLVTFVGLVFTAVMSIRCTLSYLQLVDARPTEKRCPECGSKNVRFKDRVGGISGRGATAWGLFGGSASVTYQHVLECQDCGYTTPYITEAAISTAASRMKRNAWLWGIAALACLVLLIWFFAQSMQTPTYR